MQGTIKVDPNFDHPHPLDDLGDPADQEAAARAAERADDVPHGRADPARRSTTTVRCRYPLAFDGTTTIPHLTGCGLLGPTLGTLLSGPGNAYHVTLAPPS